MKHAPTRRRLSPPFSILGRIVVVETRPGQHPQGTKHNLSVSSDGSWWLKRNGEIWNHYQASAFSILGRIVVVETTVLAAPFAGFLRLSVSSDGSWWLKLHKFRAQRGRCVALSVSSDGSWWLKLLGAGRDALRRGLSVSSDGSWWLKLKTAPRLTVS